jgi:hypothetical protein
MKTSKRRWIARQRTYAIQAALAAGATEEQAVKAADEQIVKLLTKPEPETQEAA